MTLIVVTATVFVLTLVLLFVFYYLFIEAPASKRKMQTRLAMLEETALHEPASAEMDVVRKARNCSAMSPWCIVFWSKSQSWRSCRCSFDRRI